MDQIGSLILDIGVSFVGRKVWIKLVKLLNSLVFIFVLYLIW